MFLFSCVSGSGRDVSVVVMLLVGERERVRVRALLDFCKSDSGWHQIHLYPHYTRRRVTQAFCPPLFSTSPPFFFWSSLNTPCICGSPSTLFLSGSQQSGCTSSQFSTCVTPYINTQPHVRRHSCRRPERRASTLLCSACVCVGKRCVCGVKEAIHEQLTDVKPGQCWTAVYDF